MQSISSTALEILETGALIGVSMACSNGLTITEDDIIQGTFVLDRNSVSGNIIEIGNAETSQISFVLDNHDGRYNAYSFESATLTVDFVIGLETLRAGIFIIDSSPQKTETMNITALDYMAKFNQEYSTALSDGATLLQILQDCCTTCGVTLATTTFTNSSYAALIPTEEVTFHEVVAWVAQLSGTNAWIDESGELNLSWYGAAGFDITPDNRFEGFSFSEKDITITGVTYRDQDGDVSAGTSGYAFIIEGNPLIDPDDASTIVTAIYGAVGGLTYRPYDAHLIGYPHLWPLDGVTITFPDGITTTYSIITNHRFSLNGTSLVKALGETEQAHGYIPPASLTSAQKTLIKSYAASAALTAANGKNTIYYAVTQPTGGTYIPGDTWFDTDDGNKIYEYNGTSWLAVQFGENAIADLAITDAKIANATISNAKIANVDAGKITTGVLDTSLVNIKTGTGTSRVEIVGTGINGYLGDVLRVQLEYDRLEFHRAGSSIGNIRTEYVNQYWGGSILGDCLFVESAGKSIAFNAESGSTEPSLVVFPTWAEAPVFATESINIGMLDTKQWTIDTSSTDSVFYVRETYGKGFSISTSGVFTLINSSFSRLTSWANQLDGKPYSWHIYLDGTNATLGYTNSSGVRSNYNLTHSHPYAASTHSHAWTEVTSKPSTFPPSPHTHNTYLPLSGGTMTGNINMGSADIVGSTSGCYITAERIGLGIAANSSYTVDANTSYMRANRYVVASGTSSSYFGWNSTYGLVISRASGQDNQVLFFQNSFGELGICPTVTNKGDLGQSSSANNWYRGYATAWNNASTVDNKINITRADDSEYYELAKLMNVYLYSTDEDKQDLRFGLLAEESPAEIVGLDNNTKSGKAIDLYAFTTFNFAVIKVLQEKVEQLENELEALKDGAIKTI